jgi:hypothetical protein
MTSLRIVIFIIVTSICFPKEMEAQNVNFGLTGGLTAGTPYGPSEEGATGKPGKGTMLGFFIKYKLSERFRIQSELFYSFKGASFETPVSGDTTYQKVILGTTYYIPTSYSGRVRGIFGNQYFDLPVLLTIKLNKKFYFLIGPQFSYLYKGKNTGKADIKVGSDPNNPYTTVTDEPFDQSDQINRWDYSIAGGFNYEANKRMNFNLKLTRGLRSIYKDTYTMANGTVRNIYMQCSLDYRLGRIVPKDPTD